MERYAAERALAEKLVLDAGVIALKHRQSGMAFEEKPNDLGPVTAADKEADTMIRAGIQAAFPQDALLTEETPDDGAWRHSRRVWMVDPIDGTKEFIRGHADFACMIGLCVDGVPVVGAVFKPVDGVLYAATEGSGAWKTEGGVRTRMQVAETVTEPVVVAVSKSHRSNRLETLLARLGPIRELPSGSVGLKVGLICRGDAAVYLNPTSHTSLWDTAGPMAILREAGGTATDLFGNLLTWQGSVHHGQGLFFGTVAAHAHLLSRVVETAGDVAKMLEAMPQYPGGAFRRVAG